MKFHEWGEQFKKTSAYVSPFGFTLANVKFDVTNPSTNESKTKETKINYDKQKIMKTNLTIKENKNNDYKNDNNNEPLPVSKAVKQIRGYNELLDKYSLYQFIIRYGKTLDTTPEFESFQRTNIACWGAISSVIHSLEILMGNYSIPIAHINGQAIVSLAKQEVLQFTIEDLLNCVDNNESVKQMMNEPGRRYKGTGGEKKKTKRLACILIM